MKILVNKYYIDLYNDVIVKVNEVIIKKHSKTNHVKFKVIKNNNNLSGFQKDFNYTWYVYAFKGYFKKCPKLKALLYI